MGLTYAAYASMLKALLPRGRFFEILPDSDLYKTLEAIGDELVRVSNRAEDLLEESDPRTATETLEDWERVLGLPDDVITEIPGTDAERRLAITQKLVKLGGQNPAYYVTLAAACGYTVTIDDQLHGDIARAGTAVAGDPCYGIERAFHFVVTVSAPAGTALTHAELEAVFARAKPAHTTVEFVYL